MSIVLFEDEHVGQLDPVALGKPAFTISCGSHRLLDIAEQLNHPLHGEAPPSGGDRGRRLSAIEVRSDRLPCGGVVD